jgi:hypothetical protein
MTRRFQLFTNALAVIATLQSDNTELGAQQFVETVACGPGMWEKLSPEMRQTFVFNAPTWLDEMNEPAHSPWTLNDSRRSTNRRSSRGATRARPFSELFSTPSRRHCRTRGETRFEVLDTFRI